MLSERVGSNPAVVEFFPLLHIVIHSFSILFPFNEEVTQSINHTLLHHPFLALLIKEISLKIYTTQHGMYNETLRRNPNGYHEG